MNEQEENRFGYLREKTIEELIKLKNEQIDFIDQILKEREVKRGR